MSLSSYPKLLTPEEAKRVLTLPCLLILLGDVQACFPVGTRRASWSSVVWLTPVRRAPPRLSGVKFPVVVGGLQWERCVVPVLRDPSWEGRVATSWDTDFDWLVETLGEAIRASFQANQGG